MLQLTDTILQGILLGGLYALFAIGLSLIFGVMRLVNIAHGDLIILAAYIGMAVAGTFGMHPLAGLIIVLPIMFIIGYALQRGVLNRTIGTDILPPLLVTFGLSIIIQNALNLIFTADSQRLQVGDLETDSFHIFGDIAIGVFPLIIFITSVLVVAGLQYVFYRTEVGRAFRATSDDQETAQLMGINNKHIFGLAMALALAVVGVAGVFLSIKTSFDPMAGPSRLLYGFESVIIGGLGSIWGTLAGGIILGVAQSLGAAINPAWQILAGHIAFLFILIVRPKGLFPRKVD
jgi:branched-chain amino acid transport system permease protein